jgi:single-stranded DNA-binding protein
VLDVEDINRLVLMGELVWDSTFGYAAGGAAVAAFTLAFSSDPDTQRDAKKKRGVIVIITQVIK